MVYKDILSASSVEIFLEKEEAEDNLIIHLSMMNKLEINED
jgi:hypothetical protein